MTKRIIEFEPRHIEVTGIIVIKDENDKLIDSQVTHLHFKYDKDGNLIFIE